MNILFCFIIGFVLHNLNNNNLNITTKYINFEKKFEGFDQRFNETTDLDIVKLYNIYKNLERNKLLLKLNDSSINTINKLKLIEEHDFDDKNISYNIYKNLEYDYFDGDINF
jgi:hypothetical protein